MPTIRLEHETDFDGWRAAARRLRGAGIAPREVTWSTGGELFADDPGALPDGPGFGAPAAFVDLAVKRYDFADRLCAAYGSRFVLFLQPLYWVETCQVADAATAASEKANILGHKTFPHVRDNFQTVYAALERALDGKPYYVNLRNTLCGRTSPAYTADGVHNTDSGREGIAAAMLPALRARLSLNPVTTDGGQP